LKSKKYNNIESLYVNLIASLNKTIKYTKGGENYNELVNELSIISAKVSLIAPDNINKQTETVSDVLYEWSSYYRKSLPTQIEGTNFGIHSNTNSELRDRAEEIYPILNWEIGKLIEMIKIELLGQQKLLHKYNPGLSA